MQTGISWTVSFLDQNINQGFKDRFKVKEVTFSPALNLAIKKVLG